MRAEEILNKYYATLNTPPSDFQCANLTPHYSTAVVMVCCIRSFDLNSMIAVLKSLSWTYEDRLQLYAKRETDDLFEIIDINNPPPIF